MYAYKPQVAVRQGIATLLALALALWATGAHMFMQAEAANLTYIKDTLSDSNPGSPSDHTIQFTTPSGIGAGETIVITFPNGFNIGTSSVNYTDIDLNIGGVEQVLDATPAGATWGVSTSSQDLILTSGTGIAAPNATVTIEIGLNATTGVAGNAQVTNHTATSSYEFTVTAGTADTGQFRVAIIENVLVTANISTTLTFTVNGTTTGAVCNGAAATWGPTTNTTLPFGNLQAGVPKTLCQDLTVATNARNGYTVTVMQDTQLKSSTEADIDGFVDGSWTDDPTAWAAPSNNVLDENTWGHWGLTSSDSETTRSALLEFGADEWVAASTTPSVIMGHTAPADGVTPGIGRASIGYKVQITALQEAGDDYNTTLTYVATPTF